MSIVIASIVASGLVAFAVGRIVGPGTASAGDSPGWTTYSDVQNGFTLQFPSSWSQARAKLVPNLLLPGEILSIGTGPMKVGGGGNCGMYPVEAVAAMGPRDVLVSVKEWNYRESPPWLEGTQRRPADFEFRSRQGAPLAINVRDQINRWNLDAPVGARWTDFEFRDRGRVFRVFLAIGPETSLRRQKELLSTLNSLRFEPEGG
jgi:hypothetical protein